MSLASFALRGKQKVPLRLRRRATFVKNVSGEHKNVSISLQAVSIFQRDRFELFFSLSFADVLIISNNNIEKFIFSPRVVKSWDFSRVILLPLRWSLILFGWHLWGLFNNDFGNHTKLYAFFEFRKARQLVNPIDKLYRPAAEPSNYILTIMSQ